MRDDNGRNTIIFVVVTAIFLIGYQMLVLGPQAERRKAAQQAQREASAAAAVTPDGAPSATGEPGAASTTAPRPVVVDRRQALATDALTGRGSERVIIRTPTLSGSLSLIGARVDDLYLTRYRETIAADSQPVELFRPQGMNHAYQALFGWTGANVAGGVPGPTTPWRLTEGSTLTPTTPVTLTWDNGAGLRFTRRISVDDRYVFTVRDTVANFGAAPITLRPWGRVERLGVPADLGKQQILHEGAIGTFSDDGSGYTTTQLKYGAWVKKPIEETESVGGWLGITDKYWLAALIPGQDERIDAGFRIRDGATYDTYSATMQGAERTVSPGMQITHEQRLFAGAKVNDVLTAYEKELGLPRFVYAIDWGFLFFLTRPILIVLDFFYGILGNVGLAILALTVCIKILLFPLANKAYESLSKMRNLQPKMEEIKKKHGGDAQKQQQELMALYQREKINPLAGCVPILIQIPVFYALYKVLFVTIEVRHAPFFGWIRDLSARDPSNIWNLFGLIPWDPASAPVIGGLLVGALGLGVLAIVYGFTMWLQQAMNPPPPDPVQKQIFAFLPFVFTFIMAPFAAGLLVYWIWNNVLSILQQYVIMHRFKAPNPIDGFIDKHIRKKAT
ncbi:membrane protein insertase YidC [Brevundimonas fluminis]|jgi:YidC/Oxa1 family membrane protein insertase|uniref:membrane protein insertase YidC n=1 Tax=Brevundimonas fluminis TaxID=2487274 RepID=UPI000F657C9E|nr:membrane protein insertase YidC [Brevundimonas fluminis]